MSVQTRLVRFSLSHFYTVCVSAFLFLRAIVLITIAVLIIGSRPFVRSCVLGMSGTFTGERTELGGHNGTCGSWLAQGTGDPRIQIALCVTVKKFLAILC